MNRLLAHIPGVILAGLALALLVELGPDAVALVLIAGSAVLIAAASYAVARHDAAHTTTEGVPR